MKRKKPAKAAPQRTQKPAAPKAKAQGESRMSNTQITALKASDMGGEGPRNGGNAGVTYGPEQPQDLGHRRHFDCTPTPDSKDPADPNLLRAGQGKSPKVTPRWGYYDDPAGGKNGPKVFCSKGGPGQLYAKQDRDDPFGLESYERKNENDTSGPGLTPVLLQNEPLGPGQRTCFLFFCIEAAQNEGLDVESNEVNWKAN